MSISSPRAPLSFLLSPLISESSISVSPVKPLNSKLMMVLAMTPLIIYLTSIGRASAKGTGKSEDRTIVPITY